MGAFTGLEENTMMFGVAKAKEDPYLRDRAELLAKKYTEGLTVQEATRLAEISHVLDRQELEQANFVDAQADERFERINSGLDRVEKAIRDLKTLRSH